MQLYTVYLNALCINLTTVGQPSTSISLIRSIRVQNLLSANL